MKMPSTTKAYRHTNGVFARFDDLYPEKYRRLSWRREMKELSPKKVGPVLDCSTGQETKPNENSTSVDTNHINSNQQNSYSSGAATALLQTIIKASQVSREIENKNKKGEGGLDPQYGVPMVHDISGSRPTNGEVEAQQTHSYLINNSLNTPNSEIEQSQQKGIQGIKFGNVINSGTATEFQNFFANQNPTSDLHVNTDNHLNLNHESSHLDGLPGFEDLAHVHSLGQDSPECVNDKQPVLERLLTDKKLTDNPRLTQSISSPEIQSACSPTSSCNSPYTEQNGHDTSFMEHTSPGLTFDITPTTVDTSTQSSLIARSEKLVLADAPFTVVDSEPKEHDNIEWSVTKLDEHELEQIGKPKMMRIGHERVVPLSVISPSVEHVFDAESAMQGITPEFTFHKFGQGDADQGFFHFGTEKKEIEGPVSPPSTFKTPQHPVGYGARKREQARRSREPILSQQFPSKYQNYELKILSQPEEQHRARYLTEGSRGSVKNIEGAGYPSVKLIGHTGEATLQVFVGNDNGRVRPHGFYQACKVCGKNSTPCSERDIDGTTVIEIDLKSAHDMTASIDCVGILKLRNADVEQRIGIAKAKKKSTKARMVFRVTFQKPCGNPQVLQVASSPILCTQPIGQPEICKMSLNGSVVGGGDELYIIGKNFLRGTKVLFQEVDEDGTTIKWESEGEISKDYFQTTHMIVKIPEYGCSLQPGMTVVCQVVANSGDKLSEPQGFTYRAEDIKVPVKQETPMETNEETRKRNYPFVAPEALELNQQIQPPSSSEMFKIPAAVMDGVIQQQQQQQQQQHQQQQQQQANTNTNISHMEMQETNPQNDNQSFQQQHSSQLANQGNDENCLNLNQVGYSIDMDSFNTDSVGGIATQNWNTKGNETWNSNSVESQNWSSKPAETQDWNTKPAETQDWTTKPAETHEWSTKPAETQDWNTKPAEPQDWNIKPAETNDWSTKSAEAQDWNSKPAETQDWTTKPAETHDWNSTSVVTNEWNNSEPAETHDWNTKPAETHDWITKPAETQDWNTKPAETNDWNTKPAETNEWNTKPAETFDWSNSKTTETHDWNSTPVETQDWNTKPGETHDWSSTNAETQVWNTKPAETQNWISSESETQTWNSKPAESQNWNSKNDEPSKGYSPMENETSDGIYPMNTDESYSTQTYDASMNTIKSPALSTNSYTQHQTGLTSNSYTGDSFDLNTSTGICTSDSNMISQFFQNLENSAHMLDTNNPNVSNSAVQQVVDQSTGSLFTCGPKTSVTYKVVDQSSSHLKEALTCPARSLQDFTNFSRAAGQISAMHAGNTGLKEVGVNGVNSSKEALNTPMVQSPSSNVNFLPSSHSVFPVLRNYSQVQPSSGGIQSTFIQQRPVMTPSTTVSAVSNMTVYSSTESMNNASGPNTPNMLNNQLSQLLSNMVSSAQSQTQTGSIPQQWTTAQTAPTVSTPSLGPQIIICNPGQQASQTNTGFGGAPSIVIMPAQNGQNNQVESLLRSILGSMMGQSQQQQPPTNQ